MKNLNLNLVLIILIFSLNAFGQNEKLPTQISKGIINGVAENLPKPVYPPAAAAVNANGEVKVKVEIDKEGNVISAEAVSGHPLLRNVSEEAAKLAKFKPTTLSGKPVFVTGTLVYNFVLPQVESLENKGFEEELLPLGFNLIIEVYNNSEVDAELKGILDEMFDEFRVVPEISKIKGKFTDLSLTERTKIVEEIKVYLRKNYDNSIEWQFQTGTLLGNFFGKALRKFQKGDQLSVEEIKSFSTKINNQIANVPAKFPKPVLENLEQIGSFASRNDLNSEETQEKFFKLLVDMFEIISPE